MSNTEIVEVNTQQQIAVREELDVAITSAKAYPRNVFSSLEEIKTLISVSPEIAEKMQYSVKRGNDWVTGPSVRLGELFLYAWGNLRAQGRIKEIGSNYIIAEAVCFDIEKNVAIMKEVRKSIVNKDGVRYPETLINDISQGAISIAIRNALFTIVPRVYVNEMLEYAKLIVAQHPTMKGKSVKERFDIAVKKFNEFKISKQNLLDYLAINENEVDEESINILIGLYNAVKTGEVDLKELKNENK